MAKDALREWLARPHPALDEGTSPIEIMMFRALRYEQEAYIAIDRVSFPIVCTQDEIGPYRADFRLMGKASQVVVECDGHDFHEKTKEQAARDKQRDRYMTEAGFKVLRFAGSEIYANPFACARQALRLAAGYEAAEDA